MAETTSFPVMGDYTLTFESSDGTPKTYSVTLTEGTVSYTAGHPEAIELTDATGAVVSIRDGAKTFRSTLSLRCRILDRGANSSEAVLHDLITQDGYVGSTWTGTATPTTASGERKRFKLTLAAANVGSVKGASYVWTSVDVEPGYTWDITANGCLVNATFKSTQQKPTITRNV